MQGLLQVALFVALTHSATALECYECADCTVPFSSYYASTVECQNASCMKMNITTKSTRHTQIVSRGCSSYGYEAERCERREVSGTISEICYCNDDECNGSTTTKTTLTTFICLSLMTTLFAWRHL